MKPRMACVDIPQLALQILLRERPEWRGNPVVVLDRDEATGRVLMANQEAQNLGIGAGLMYGPCLGIQRQLKGAVVAKQEIERTRAGILECLQRFSPMVETAWFQDGVFWLDARGLGFLYAGAKAWMKDIVEGLKDFELQFALSVGHRRMATFAAARTQGVGSETVFSDAEDENRWLSRVPVDVFLENADTRRLLHRLKLDTVGQLAAIPDRDIHRRLGADAAKMLVFLKGERNLPLQYAVQNDPTEWHLRLDSPAQKIPELLHYGHILLTRCLEQAQKRSLLVQVLDFTFLGESEIVSAVIKPSQPSRDPIKLTRLLEARLEYLDFPESVGELRLSGLLVTSAKKQNDLFETDHLRHRREAARVLKSLQAERGLESVQRVRVLDNPLPTDQFRFEDWEDFPAKKFIPADSPEIPPRLVRRVALEPSALGVQAQVYSQVIYSGAWWSRPYEYHMAYSRIQGQWRWLQKDRQGPWVSLGAVD